MQLDHKTFVGRSLATLVVEADDTLKQVRKVDLHMGDQMFVRTRNSVYAIQVMEGGMYLVSGGWFDRKGLSPVKTSITGCTWGGSAVKVDIVAASGLCLEFGNRLVTSAIRKIFVIPCACKN